MADIFISYKSERRPAARHLKKVLDCYFQTGAEECVWYDYGLIPGHDFEPRIMAEIAKAKVVLVLWCEMSVKSSWVIKEAHEARRNSKFLPVRIEACMLPEDFAGADTINLAAWNAAPRDPMLDRLLDDVGRRIGREPVSSISHLRHLEEDWRGYGAPSLAHFALGKSLEPSSRAFANRKSATLGARPSSLSANLAQHWANAQLGDAAALLQIASHFESGKGGCAKDDREAARLYRIAADEGNLEAMSALGGMYSEGRGGLPKDYKESFRLRKLAADRGLAYAQCFLAMDYEIGGAGAPKDQSEAVRYYKLSADQGYAAAQVFLAHKYQAGDGVQKDDVEAVRLLKLAADQGDSIGLFELGRLCEIGYGGLPPDHREAFRLYSLSAGKNGISALIRLGNFYEFGLGGVRSNREVAIDYYRRAARLGDRGAQQQLSRMGEVS